MKRLLTIILLLSSVILVRAQNIKNNSGKNIKNLDAGSRLDLGLSINPGISLGNSASEFILGGELSLYKNLNTHLDLTFTSGFTQFFKRYYENEILIPVKAGVRYSLNRPFYLAAQTGVAFSTTDGGAYFTYSSSAGWKMSKQFDFGLKYDHFSNEPSVLGLNLTYRINL